MGSKPSGISASRGASILGLSKWSTPLETWIKIMMDMDPEFCEKNGYKEPEPVDNAPMRWGLAFEEAVIAQAEEIKGHVITHREHEFINKNFDFLTCHVDGLYLMDELDQIVHEGKTTNIYTFRDEWGEPGTDRIPQEYQIQVQHQMLCSGIKKAIVSVLVFPCRVEDWEEAGKAPEIVDSLDWASMLAEMGFFHQYEIEADEDLQALMLDIYETWWKEHVIAVKPPEPQNYEDIRRLVIAPKGTIVADKTIERLSAEYKDINTEMKSVKKRKDDLKTKILEEMRQKSDVPIDDESQEKWILKNRKGDNLHSYNGKTFR